MESFFDPNDGNPKVVVEISGKTPELKKKITALFDTGHNGSLSLPILDLIEIGATLSSFGEVVYASGHYGVVYYFSVNVTVDGRTKEVEAGMIENPEAKEAIAGLQLFSPYVSFINFKNKSIGFVDAEEFERILSEVKTPDTNKPVS